MRRIAARLWRGTRGSVQWRLLWLANATFMIGVTGVVRDDRGRFLLLRHRMWPEDRQWGLPSGYAVRGEEFGATVEREVREETTLEVRAGRLLWLRSGYRLRAEVAYEAFLVGGTLKPERTEILEARWCAPDELPDGVQPIHRELIALALEGTGGPGGPERATPPGR
ncbi:NUDIX domain-containing protein [Streptomyces alkaliphilus]|uniref:NUDIX domain-containing protein n=1 Tax=Streptomyces alkaliphilus TaxID=1472722 RepID=A0A7W3Y1G7_9ACTN|nr:NUDIX domain-containing protein [Streptomyces alkaliphilus]MBB0244483.1 NUDIX domain-containing protein [Streptomyces alkaliphilus]